MIEMLIVIPILCMMAAGVAQFAILFQAQSSFEHACGLAARYYAAGELDPNGFAEEVWDDLGSDQKYFTPGSILAVPIPTQSIASSGWLDRLNLLGPLVSKIKQFTVNYTGQKWFVTIHYHSAPFFGLLFPGGLVLKTQLAVLKYPDPPVNGVGGP